MDVAELKLCSLDGLTLLQLTNCQLKNSDMIHLSELIPCLPKLAELDVSFNRPEDICLDGLIMVLQQLCHSSVTTLDITNTKTQLVGPLHDYPPCNYYFALETLINSGRLEVLRFGDSGEYDLRSHDFFVSPSSLKSLRLYGDVDFTLSGFESNFSLSKLEVEISITSFNFIYPQALLAELVKILKCNRTLQELSLKPFPYQDIAYVRAFVGALDENKTLQKVTVYVKRSMIINFKTATINSEINSEFASDSRIVVEQYM